MMNAMMMNAMKNAMMMNAMKNAMMKVTKKAMVKLMKKAMMNVMKKATIKTKAPNPFAAKEQIVDIMNSAPAGSDPDPKTGCGS